MVKVAFYFEKNLDQTLLEIKHRLSEVTVTYPTLSRIGLDQAENLIIEYLPKHSEGAHPEVITF